MNLHVDPRRVVGARSPLLYGHFIEHFHRQIYGGIYDPQSPFADADGMRSDVIEALRRIRIPVLRWPGGCFVSSYHWKDGVGPQRTPFFDKAWRVEEPNLFGTDEFILLCRKLGCEPYICTNAGTGTPEEMSDWVEYCNLESQGQYARWRIANGFSAPHKVKYWSIGNENYGFWEIGAKSSEEWGRLAEESAKMMKHVDPAIELSAAALSDPDWNLNLLRRCGKFLDWISIHEYWDHVHETNQCADYLTVMSFTDDIAHAIREVRGLLCALKLERKIKIAFDEWNLREWYHPGVHTVEQARTPKEYLYPRDQNDDNSLYTMADAVFSACFLNALNRNCDIVGMANFAPAVNTRGCIFTHPEGIVLRPTYHVFELYTNLLGDIVLDSWAEDMPTLELPGSSAASGGCTSALDLLATRWSDRPGLSVAAVNKSPDTDALLSLDCGPAAGSVTVYSLSGSSPDSYNGIGHTEVSVETSAETPYTPGMQLTLRPHSVNIIQLR